MRLKTKLIIAGVSVAAAAITGAVVVVRKKRQSKKNQKKKHQKKKQKSSLLTEEVRVSVEELLRLKGEDFVPDGLGTSLYQRKLGTLTDRQLMGVYALVKTGEVLRQRGVDLRSMSKADVDEVVSGLRMALDNKEDRHELILRLEEFGADVFKSMLGDGMQLAKLSMQDS